MKSKILFIFGTRPEAIKMAPLIKEVEKSKKLDARICVTAQHREMLDQVLKIFEIKPDHDLNIMTANQNLFDITARIISKLQNVLEVEKPDLLSCKVIRRRHLSHPSLHSIRGRKLHISKRV